MGLMGYIWNVAEIRKGGREGSYKMTIGLSAVVSKVIMFKV